jgi:biotin-dependent carboxylase-like uncharacterized protein
VRRDVFEVVSSGGRATFQDAGRPGHAAIGVSPSGSADPGAAGLANRLTATATGAPVVEVMIGGLVLRARRPARIAVTGAPRPVHAGGRAAAMSTPVDVDVGDELRIGHGPRGVFTYLAVEGGFLTERVLGSASTDSLSGLGPPPLAAGDVLARDDLHDASATVDVAPVLSLPDVVELRVHPGPRGEWFAGGGLHALTATTWTATATSDRVGLRLAGPTALVRDHAGELPSEGAVRGAVQVPPDGMPVVLGPDHPVTGGYPVVAVVDRRDLALASQCEPGRPVRFRPAPARRTVRASG